MNTHEEGSFFTRREILEAQSPTDLLSLRAKYTKESLQQSQNIQEIDEVMKGYGIDAEDQMLIDMPALVLLDLKEGLLAQMSDLERVIHKINAIQNSQNL